MPTEPHNTIRLSHRFTASPERVFDAWLDPETIRKWLFATPTGEIVRTDIDARVHGSFTITDRRDGADVDHVGEYLEIVRPWKLVFNFRVPKYSTENTVVTIEIEALGAGCELHLTHEGVLPEWYEPTTQGWTGLLATLESVLSA